MTEKTVIENRSTGNRWQISIERELRQETGAKYPNKTVVHASLEGYEANYEEAKKSLLAAKAELDKIVPEHQ